ncbi:serine/threonine protein kinase US3 [Equid alphaherpesvirus 4]|uniref:non-specific serine/threonine protein kinase n=2 Tax=Equid alphaherpesvirus 4 TaxID=10331 RepID=A0A288CFW4_EHV4|nr:serine/threonine protein kinase US3 [Equid alphaherpesvirus 4]AAC59588.1 69 [Equid alphaherpesvirus 4]AMB15948.1 serine/threonine protein kinase US3 [Equid alphaherpesvirus 4]AMB16027.1 serine/threonine protein kinase US3 [Equid alphaherpesvirus 4]AMB16106.1 serine/threonine protein kinase US3 [Equid alphaherpesvirus 4]AMB16185.1 serine/threonine protein kinase US3 [Equid alphaherpesvirus 4]
MENKQYDHLLSDWLSGNISEASESMDTTPPLQLSVHPQNPSCGGAAANEDLYSDISDGDLECSDCDSASESDEDDDDGLMPPKEKAKEVAASFGFKVIKTLTPGSEGRVMVATKEGQPDQVVLKIGQKGTTLIEAMMLRNVNHPCVIKMKDTLVSGGITCMVLPHYNSDLYTFLTRRSTRIPIDQALIIERQILEGLRYLHAQRIIHRDVKTENIFINSVDQVCIADFGAAQFPVVDPMDLGLAGTVETNAPEVLARAKYNSKVDIWSAGIVLFEMLAYPSTLFEDPPSTPQEYVKSCHSQLLRIISKLKINPEEFPREPESRLVRGYIEYASLERKPHTRYPCFQRVNLHIDGEFLIHKMLAFNAAMRPSAEELLSYPMFMNL